MNDITYFGKTNSRGKEVEFGIRDEDRLKHIYIIGKTGMGKSTLLENMAVQDIKKGNGLAFIDPHGSAIETFLDYVPENRINDVVYFAPFDVDYPIAFNPLENTDPTKRYLTAQGLMAAFKKIFGEESFSDRMQHMTNNALLALLEYPEATLLHITRMLSDDAFRDDVIKYITDPSVKAYWVNEFNMWDEKFRREASAAVLNKIGQFTTNPLIRNIIGQEKSTFDFRDIIDNRKILLVNLSKGQIGEDNANLLGAMLTTKLYLAAMSRADKTKSEIKNLPSFYLYIDEFQNLANDSFANILAEARKYKLSLILAHQYMEQMPDTIRAAVFGNIGTMISFQVGAIDAEILEQQFLPIFTAEDFTNLGFTEIYLRMAIEGITSAPFSASTLPPIQKPEISFTEEVINASRRNFAHSRVLAEEKIVKWIEKKYVDNKALEKLKEKLDWEREKYFKYGAKKYEPNDEVILEAREKLGFTSFEDEKKEGEIKIEPVIEKKENIPHSKDDLSFEAFKKMKEGDKKEVKEIIVDEKKYSQSDKKDFVILTDEEKFILEMQKKDGFLPKDFEKKDDRIQDIGDDKIKTQNAEIVKIQKEIKEDVVKVKEFKVKKQKKNVDSRKKTGGEVDKKTKHKDKDKDKDRDRSKRKAVGNDTENKKVVKVKNKKKENKEIKKSTVDNNIKKEKKIKNQDEENPFKTAFKNQLNSNSSDDLKSFLKKIKED